MRFIDTHTHLYLPSFETEEENSSDVVARAIASGVDRLIFPNVDKTTVSPMHELADRFPDNIFVAMGLHPTEIGEDWEEVLSEIESHFGSNRRYVAVGEIGIDLYWDKTFADQQMQAFDRQIAKAVDLNLPVIIHSREGLDQTLEVLQGYRDVRAVFHSFGGTEKDVDAIRRVGDFYFGINGIVTFKNSGLKATLPAIGLERILLETDAPYLAPVPHRGKRNESSYIPLIGATVADALSTDTETVAEATTANAESLFGI